MAHQAAARRCSGSPSRSAVASLALCACSQHANNSVESTRIRAYAPSVLHQAQALPSVVPAGLELLQVRARCKESPGGVCGRVVQVLLAPPLAPVPGGAQAPRRAVHRGCARAEECGRAAAQATRHAAASAPTARAPVRHRRRRPPCVLPPPQSTHHARLPHLLAAAGGIDAEPGGACRSL